MKKLILSLAAVALAVTGCKVSEVEGTNTPEQGRQVTVVASMGAQTKVDFDDNWNATWSANDKMSAWEVGSQNLSQFLSDCEAGASEAEFTGSLSGAGDIRFVYPYTQAAIVDADGYYLNTFNEDYKMNASLCNQSVDMENPKANLAQSSILLSGILANETEDFFMDYVNAFVNVNVKLSGLAADETATITGLNIYGLTAEAFVNLNTASLTDCVEPLDGEIAPRSVASPIKVAVSNSKAYSNGDVVTIPVTSFPTDIEVGDEVSVEVIFTRTKGEVETMNQMGTGVLKAGWAAPIRRSQVSEVNVEADLVFEADTPEGEDFVITDITTSTSTIEFKYDINLDRCQAVAMGYQQTEGFSIDNLWIASDDVRKDTEGSVKFEYLTSETDYTIWAVIVEPSVDEWGNNVYAAVEGAEFTLIETKTKGKEIGAGNLVVISDVATTSTSITATISNGGDENITGVNYSAVKKSELGSQDLKEYLIQNSFLAQPSQQYPSSFNNMPIQAQVMMDINSNNIVEGTDYVLFALGSTSDGTIGEPVSVECTTLAIQKSDIEVSIEVTPDVNTFKCKVVIPSDATYDQIATYVYTTGETLDEANIEANLMTKAIATNMADHEDNAYGDDNPDMFVIEWTETIYQSLDKERTLYVMAGDSRTMMAGPLQKSEPFKLKQITYSDDLTIGIDILSVTKPESYYYEVTIDLVKGAGVVDYIYGTVDKDYISRDSNMELWGNYLLQNAWCQIYHDNAEDGQIKMELYSENYYPVFVPVDADGNYGTPIVPRWDKVEVTPYVPGETEE